MQVWLKTKWHREPNKRMRHLVTPPVNTTCGPFFGRGEMVHEDLKWHFILAELLTCAILYTKACIVALNLNLTCWHASGVKRGRKKEEILRGYFIHSMCPPLSFPVCLLMTNRNQINIRYDHCVWSAPASIWFSGCTQPTYIWWWIVYVQIVSREQQQRRPCTLGSLQTHQCPFKGKSAVQLAHLPPLFTSLVGGKGCTKCSYTRRAWEKNAIQSGIINVNTVGLLFLFVFSC